MKIAITSANGRSICGHAGKCPGFLVYSFEDENSAEPTHIKLKKDQVFKNMNGFLSDNLQHPLYGIDMLITQSLGSCLKTRLQMDNIEVLTTNADNPAMLINQIVNPMVN